MTIGAVSSAGPSVSEQLVAHALSTSWAAMPEAARVAAKAFLYDTIAVAIAGRHAPHAEAIAAAAQDWAGRVGTSPVFGRPGLRLTAPYAAFVNAFQAHAQEFDCVHEAAVAHPMASVGAVLFAEATRSGPYGGADLLAAMSAGVDVLATLGVASISPLKFFRPSTLGVFASVAALCRLRRLEQATAQDAFGYALAFASGTMQAHVEGKPTLAVQVAAAARSAVEAVDLAVAGLSGPAGSIDGPFGYFSLFEDEVDTAPALTQLGKIHRVTELSWKPFPTGRAAQGAIVALQALMAQGVDAANLDRFIYSAPPLIGRLVGRRPFPEMGVAYARLCLPWLGAVVLTRGAVGLEDFTPERLADPALHALAERIVVESNEDPDPAAFVPAVGVAILKDGRALKHDVSRQLGSPQQPLSPEQRLAKMRACLRFAKGPPVEVELASLVEIFDTLDDAAGAVFTLLERAA
jgi:2-methylcitrate dehydratase PrpD